MTEQYELYCLTDPVFYKAPDVRCTDEQVFPIGAGPVPEDWDHHPDDTWMYYQPRRVVLPNASTPPPAPARPATAPQATT
jgi:hypothetical protein